MKSTIADSFHQQYARGEGCWTWQRARDSDGYGHFSHKGKWTKAHRYAYALAYGEIPSGMHVLHRCDNPSCVNPTHLFAGTDRDNVLDARAKGRMNSPVFRGEAHGMAILSESQVRAIRTQLAAGDSRRQVADRFGISYSLLYRIATRRIWWHI